MAELDRLGAMRPGADRVLQALVDDARKVFEAEFCMVNLVTADTQFYKVWSGELPPAVAAVRLNPREPSMCRHVVEEERPFVVEDFSTTERFWEQHLRMGPGVRFYAGTPLKTSEGLAIGSLCLVDSRPREFGDKDRATLRAFAGAVVGRLEALGAAAQERDARESERQYRRNVFELANDAILIYGTDTGLILGANRRACEMYGIPQEDFKGRDIAELSFERESEEEHTREVLRRGSHRGFEAAHRRADGARMHVSINSSVTEYGGQRAILSIVRDVTERKRTEESLSLSERSLAQAQRIAQIGNWEHELRDGRTRWSDEMYRIFGFAPRTLVPSYKTFMLFVHPDDGDLVRGSIRGVLRGNRPEDVEYRIVRPDGDVRFVHTQYEVSYDESGRPAKFSGTVHDVTDRKHVEQKLKETEERYRLLVEQIPAVAYIDRADAADVAFYTSPRIEALLGYTPEEWLEGRLWLERLHPDDRDWVLEADTRARTAEEPFGEEYRLIARDGRTVWVRDGSELLRDEAGRPLLRHGVLLDITERKRAEEALRRSEERLRSLIQNAPDVIVVLDAEGRILYDGPSIQRVLGYEPGERVGSKGLDYVHPEDVARAAQTLAETLGSPGAEVPVEYRLRHKDGSWRHFEATRTNLLDDPAIGGIVINCRDVTERRRAEGALRRSEERHRLVGRATNEVIWDNDIATGRQVWDGAVSAMFGYSPEELGSEGRWWQERIHPEDRPRVLSGLEALLGGDGEVWTEEYRFRRRDGTYATVVDRGYVVRDGEGRPVRMLGSMMDISERKRTEEALRESEGRHRRQARELVLLHQVRTALAQDLEPPAVFRAVVEAIAQTYGYTQVSAYRLQGETLELQHQVGYERVLDRIPVTRGVMGRVARTRRPVLLGDVRSDPAFLGAIEGITSEICVPLLDEGEVVGTLNVESTSGVELTGDDLRVVAALAEHVNVALRRARLLSRVRESEERFRSLLQNASDVITLLEVDGTILYESPSVERTLGYGPEELVGENAFDYVHPDDLEHVSAAFSEMLADPDLRPSVEYRFRRKDGSWCYLESIGSNLLDDPKVEELVVNSRDITERKRWEEKLRGAEERYRGLVETIPAITYMGELDEVSTSIYVSPQVEAILGFTAEERMATPDLWVRHLHPEDRERVLAANALSNATGDPFDEEYRMVTRDGREVWMHDASVVLRDAEEGRPSYRQGVMFDVTERRKTEEALHASERRLRTVIEQSPLGINIFDPDGTSLLTNGAWDELWYLDDGEAARQANVFEDEHLRDAGLIRYVERSVSQGAPVVAPLLLFDPARGGREGRPRWLRTLVYPVKGGDGRVLETVLLLEDFTERKRAEDALKESEERYRAVVEQSAEAIWMFDPETKRVLETNAAFQEMLGFDAEELRGMTNYDFVAHSREDVDRTVGLKMRGEENSRSERKYRMKDGTLLDVEVGGTVISYRGKEVVCSVARDITERKRVEEEIRETNRRLGELATLRADFTAMVAHELDTPLAVIRGYADVLATGELGPAERERALAQIQSETDVLNTLVGDVRVAASAERRDFAVNPREVPVDELLDAAARFVVTLPGDNPLELEHATDAARYDGVRAGYADAFVFGNGDGGREVWADRYRIGQVLRNLLANAVKYSPEGAPIGLRAVPGEAPGRLRIEVSDRGSGIHPDDLGRVFEKFGRGRSLEGKKVSGIGLGLYLSRRILRAHGSDLTVDARPGGGSVFGFELEEVAR
ncbi:MAG TPA: PAS domain S-box protein [Rubrobacter sp.]|nr:PAS domain S-box protein [Rubrobacter sp.]